MVFVKIGLGYSMTNNSLLNIEMQSKYPYTIKSNTNAIEVSFEDQVLVNRPFPLSEAIS